MTGRFLIVLVSAGLALMAFGLASAAPARAPFAVRSTLDRKTVLPHRIRWLAFPHVPTSQVREVEFLIDGKVRWIEHNAPYSYSDDGGLLVTTWLGPGPHRFTVRATSTSGRKAMDTVIARVVALPSLPTALSGSWRREIVTPVPPIRAIRATPSLPERGRSSSLPAGSKATSPVRSIQQQAPRPAPETFCSTTTPQGRATSRCTAQSQQDSSTPTPPRAVAGGAAPAGQRQPTPGRSAGTRSRSPRPEAGTPAANAAASSEASGHEPANAPQKDPRAIQENHGRSGSWP